MDLYNYKVSTLCVFFPSWFPCKVPFTTSNISMLFRGQELTMVQVICKYQECTPRYFESIKW